MLSQIVRPMVHTQVRLLASCEATRSTLIKTVAQWLGFLGVHAQVTHLEAGVDKRIRISLTVGQPEACDDNDWQQIISKLNKNASDTNVSKITPPITPKQESKLQRLLAYVIQVGCPDEPVNWEAIAPQLQALGMNESMLLGIRSALKVPQSLEQLMEGLEPDLAAIALPQVVSIALLDRQVNAGEDDALAALLKLMK
ncbi:MAG TPA: hypothetical protein V6C90_27640 [Coleofasciculaceae cyanobacterium]|jgi:hypothetical protein